MPFELNSPGCKSVGKKSDENVAQLQNSRNESSFTSNYRTEIAACIGSVISTFIAVGFSKFPLDSVKTRMQTCQYKGYADCVRHTYKTEGYRGFIRGVVAPLLSVTIVRTVSFSIYQRSKYNYATWFKQNFGIDPLLHINTPGNYPNISTISCFGVAGATAGSVITLASCPFELTKLSAQVSNLDVDMKTGEYKSSDARKIAATYQNKGTFMTAKNIIKNRGILGLYTGFHLHLLRDTLGTATYFMTYESAKQVLTTVSPNKSSGNPLAIIIAGGVCGIASWALIYPIDSAKSIYQKNSLTTKKGEPVPRPPRIQFRNRRMYRGLGVSMGRSCLVNSVFFSAFEFIKKNVVDVEN